MAYILFADDESNAVQQAATYLTGHGHRCVVVRNGLDALAQMSEELPDILVTDLMMPGADGYQVMREMWKLYPEKRVGIVVLVAISAEREPGRFWQEDWPVDSFVLRHRDVRTFGWQIVLAVEQLLHRQILIPSRPAPSCGG